MYFQSLVVIIGIIGTAANGLVLYALVASKQHKKHELIVNQNAIDLYCCVFLVITYGLKLSNIYLSGSLGYWLCMFLFSESLLFCGLYASWINLMFISIERYLKVVRADWSKRKLRKWMTYAAIACTWISGVIQEMVLVFKTSAVMEGVCYGYAISSAKTRLFVCIYHFSASYVLVLVIFIFCYLKILTVIRRQTRVVASYYPDGSAGHNDGGSAVHNLGGPAGHNDGGPSGHNPDGSNPAQTQLNQIQTNVIKTMTLVCTFYAIAWLPEKLFMLVAGVYPGVFAALGINLNKLNNVYYAAMFLGFLYICANLTIIVFRRCLDVVN